MVFGVWCFFFPIGVNGPVFSLANLMNRGGKLWSLGKVLGVLRSAPNGGAGGGGLVFPAFFEHFHEFQMLLSRSLLE